MTTKQSSQKRTHRGKPKMNVAVLRATTALAALLIFGTLALKSEIGPGVAFQAQTVLGMQVGTVSHRGVPVERVRSGSQAAKSGISPGDWIVAVERVGFRTRDEYLALLRAHHQPVIKLLVERDSLVTEVMIPRDSTSNAFGDGKVAWRRCATFCPADTTEWWECGCATARRKVCNGCARARE